MKILIFLLINKHPSIAEIKLAIENGNLNGMCEKLENILEKCYRDEIPGNR